MKDLLLLFLILFAVGLCSSDAYHHLGYFESPFSAFVHIGSFEGKKTLYYTSFPIPGAISHVPDITPKLGNIPAIKPETVVKGLTWPNEVIDVPEEVLGPNFVLTCGGFLVPTYRTGAVTLVDVKNKTSYQVSVDENGYFYHLGAFYDVDEDGLLDIISAKTNYPLIGAGDGKLVWFKNPGTMTFPWKESLLFKGPDVFFRIFDLDQDGRDEIVASIFVNQRLSIFKNKGRFENTADWEERVIDDALGAPFDVRVADLNFDGSLDLLVTNHQDKIEESAVFGYEVPGDLLAGEYVRHIIATGFETTQPGDGQASPGSAQPFYPNLSRTNEKPLIMVSGDGTQKAHLLRPKSEDPSSWEYVMETVIFVNNTVGGIAIDDVDGDGYSDVFVPNYNDGRIHIFTFSPN